jgi:DNA-3-methyladenine glycosylase
MNIDRTLNGSDLHGSTLWIEQPQNFAIPKIVRATRIGVDYAGAWAKKPWRFFDGHSPYVSTVPAATRKRALAEANSPTPGRERRKRGV